MIDAVCIDNVAVAAGCSRHELVSFVGGGGKTTLMHAFAQQLTGVRVATTTTRMAADQHGGLLVVDGNAEDDEIVAAASLQPIVVWTSVGADKASGLEPARCDRLFAVIDHLLVEADGSRSLPFKAPGPSEPVVPTTTTMLVSVIGADALGQTIETHCHRPGRVAALGGCTPSQPLTPSIAASVLLHELGCRSALRSHGRLVIAITKVDDNNVGLASSLADELRHREPDVAVIPVRSTR